MICFHAYYLDMQVGICRGTPTGTRGLTQTHTRGRPVPKHIGTYPHEGYQGYVPTTGIPMGTCILVAHRYLTTKARPPHRCLVPLIVAIVSTQGRVVVGLLRHRLVVPVLLLV